MSSITLPTDPNGTTIEADPDLPVITIVRDSPPRPSASIGRGPILSWWSAGWARTGPR